MCENNWLNGDRETIEKMIDSFIDIDNTIDYTRALKEIV
jgi:hypothetical protein